MQLKKNDQTIYEKYWVPLENKGKLPTDMKNTDILRTKENYPPIWEILSAFWE